jgi:2-dehydro-3-deoxygluconokinase
VALTAAPGERLEDAPSLAVSVAGAEFNVSVAWSRLGLTARFFGAVGDDAWGRRIRRAARGEGVDVRGLVTDPSRPTALLFKEWVGGRARVTYRRTGCAGSGYRVPDDLAQCLADVAAVHTTGISWVLSPDLRAACEAFYAQAPEGALRTFDLNVRRRLAPSAVWRALLVAACDRADVVIAGREELAAIGADAEAAAARLVQRGGVLVERASAGASTRVHTAEGWITCTPAPEVASVLDEVGAGDAFCAALVAYRLRGADWREAVRAGHLAGSQVVTMRGDYEGVPTSDELAEAMRGDPLSR